MVSRALLPLLISAELAIVQGDTSSALGGALAAQLAGVPVGHVEAGLRSHDLRRPWPEEELRVAIDSQADLLFAPTELSVANLRRERVGGRIFLTGNTGIDAVLPKLRSSRPRASSDGPPRLLVTCHRRENWGEGLASIADALRRLVWEKTATVDLILHPNPSVAAQMRLLLGSEPGVVLHQPCSHSELVGRMLDADLVLSDSGGIQEEAAALGIPVLVLRERTERPEAIATGHLTLAGLNSGDIVDAVRRMLSRDASTLCECPYGDGGAAVKIARHVAEWLSERRLNSAHSEPSHSPSSETFASRRLAT
jgi:UDP-N-acetylglucosamine 2-epimerase (non-hydrolysing)